MTWDEFEEMLCEHGWNPQDAKRERESAERGYAGDPDGEL